MSWKQHPTKQQLYRNQLPISKSIQIRRTRHAGHCWRSKDGFLSNVLRYNPSNGRASVSRPARFSNNGSARTRDVVWKTCLKWWMIGTIGERERESGKSVLNMMMMMILPCNSVLLSNTNDLHPIVWFQVFQSDINNSCAIIYLKVTVPVW